MSFYEEIAPYYDAIFPVDEKEMTFIAHRLQGKKSILDAGCGTGNKTVFLGEGSASIVGFDNNAEMIAAAKMRHSRGNISYFTHDIEALDSLLPGSTFDAVVCLGNTLVHIAERPGIQRFLASAYSKLEPSGELFLQILNYRHILEANISALPALEAEQLRFTRNYAWKNGKMHFCTELSGAKNGKTYTNDILLYPLTEEELKSDLIHAGFTEISFFGGYDGSPLATDSFVLIASCIK